MRSIGDNLQATKVRIARAAAAAGRPSEAVTLLAVSKTQPAARVEQAHAAGQRAFGENYVQEALAKMDALAGKPLEWHLIGPLQSNKTRLAAERFDWALQVLVQVNVAGEASKSGVAPEAAPALARAVAALPRLRLRGLMAIPEPTADMALQRARFRALRELLERLRREGLDLDTLSMGMSDDLEAAIAEGATIVRVGTAIFGAREKVETAA